MKSKLLRVKGKSFFFIKEEVKVKVNKCREEERPINWNRPKYACFYIFCRSCRNKNSFHLFQYSIFKFLSCVAEESNIFDSKIIVLIFQINIIKDLFRNNHLNYIQFGIFSQILHPLLTTCVAPILLLTVLNYRIFLGSARVPSNSSQETNLSSIMIAIVSVFIVMAIPKMALNLFEVSTIPNIVDCRQRGCGYNISSQRWLADSVVRQDIK